MSKTDIDLREIDAQIDAWVEKTSRMTGNVCQERQPWNNAVTADAIRHFAYGTDDDNPLWTDPDYAARSAFGKLQAPPTFLVSNLYPILHGAPMKAPLASLIGGVEYEWFKPISVGDRLRPEARQKDFQEKRNKQGRRLNFVTSDITYYDQDDQLVGRATCTMIMAAQIGTQLMMEHQIQSYSRNRIEEMETVWRSEKRCGSELRHIEDVALDEEVPSILRGPLSIGDMVAWNAAIGPSYKAGRWGYLDLAKSMHTAMYNPVTGFPVKYSQQHEDYNLAAGRGMPAPFDNGVMRFAWVAPLVTNWMGDAGFLKRLNVQIKLPGLYGDLVTYEAKVIGKDEATGVVSLDITGTNQNGKLATTGGAEVILPRRN
ncbi:MAG: MaoC family dehydratase N-terminal domain-containing protein [Pseudomonadota bacterium]|nr:MaoC family dehydratase N-terminal domain-containing protein [Pseudomonadota bacterium]